MNAEQFCYWLQGAIELGRVSKMDEIQVLIVQDHLDLVFKKVTPQRQTSVTPPPVPPPVQLPQPVKGPTIVDMPFQWPQDTIKTPFQVPTITC